MIFSKSAYLDYEIAGTRRRANLTRSPFVIGSGEDCDLKVVSPQIAPRHVEFVKDGKRWNLRQIGTNLLQFNGQTLRDFDRHVSHGDVIELAGVIVFTFNDPVKLAEDAKASKQQEKDKAEDAKLQEGVSLKTGFGFVLIAWIVIGLIVFAALGQEDGNTGLTTVTPKNIEIVVADLGSCLDGAAKRFEAGDLLPDIDRRDEYWQLASARAQGEDIAERLEVLRVETRFAFAEAMLAETNHDNDRAENIYADIRENVPDFSCLAHRLAAARLNTIKN